ncbi:MAG TPA: sulfate adenylyltransferase [Candidatus Acidoferrales bacterium]|nr:sulfate adenylyltransferase [Candidatus Acidoferrales bacterium]
MSLSRPHGGKLVNRIVEGAERERLLDEAKSLPPVLLNARQLSDVEQISVGAFSPLQGFMNQRDYRSVLATQRLASGLPWTIPVTLAITADQAKTLRGAARVALTGDDGQIYAILEVEEVFSYDREAEARQVLLTTEEKHPGVQYLNGVGDCCLAGPIQLLRRPDRGEFANYLLDPKETRFLFEHRGWRTVVAFQTRNPVHRAHEYILKCALETVDGLLLHPLVGATRDEDVPASVRMRCYLALMQTAYPASRTVLSVYPAAMRYAGPREAIFHAIARKNYGCTHFIVGRDHAGVGNYYGTYDAQRKFFEFEPGELGITPICFDHTFFCVRCGEMASEKTCRHAPEDRVILSGTKVREMLRAGKDLPREFTRPEVAEILREAYQSQAS